MKNLPWILLLFFSSLALAGGVGDGAGGHMVLNQDDLVAKDRAFEIDARWPQAGGYGVNQLCVNSTGLQTAQPVEVCNQWKDTTRRGNAYSGREQTCVDKEVRVVQIPTREATTYQVDYYSFARAYRDAKLLGTQEYTIPECPVETTASYSTDY